MKKLPDFFAPQAKISGNFFVTYVEGIFSVTDTGLPRILFHSTYSTPMNDMTSRFREFLDKSQVLDNDLWREIYARDASYFDLKPECVVRPKTIEEVRRVLEVAREAGVGVTFRTAGTSLSGQTVNTGIICELRTDWKRAEVRDGGKRIWFEPGLTANQVNNLLRPHHYRIGPDPASSRAAMMGGILSNNSSGMTAGVEYNSYHTLASLEFMLANGHTYNSAIPADRKRFEKEERELCEGLMRIRHEILADDKVRRKIETKYKIKNVTGYAMNSFVDFDNPMDIFTHVLIGSEGTLAYIVSGELNTRPLSSIYSSAMLYFEDVTKAAAQAHLLGASGALAVEMMDYASLRTSQGLANDLPKGTTAILLDFGADSQEEMTEIIGRMKPIINALPGLIHCDEFTHTVAERARLWQIRDGVFPCVAGARVPGATVILEDIVAPVEHLDSLVEGVQRLFHKHGYEGAIFGHARAGNIHPLVTSKMDSAATIDNFKRFMDGFVDHVLSLNGSLKGEHGTGRAIAPFVEREWGAKIYGYMKELKRLADPANVLNPGVIINDDPECFIRPIKSMDLFGDRLGYAEADKCMECGYCEHCCPSRYITLTPRQRLQAQRIIARTGSKKLLKENKFIGEESCCVDGTCMLQCPMKINTGVITDAVRVISNKSIFDMAMSASADHYGAVEKVIRGALKAAVASEQVITPYPLIWGADFLHKIYRQVPHWSKDFPMPARIPWRDANGVPDFVYFPSCVTRIFGASNFGKDDMITVMLRVGERAGYNMALPHEMHGQCCSQIWEHKGDPEGQRTVANKTVETFYRVSMEGQVPIVCDTTSCTHTLLTLAKDENLFTEENLRKYKALKIIDITTWLDEYVMPRLKVTRPKKRVLLHPTCASKLMGVNTVMIKVANECAREADVMSDAYCCGAAGDRGFIFPEIAKAACRDEKRQIGDTDYDGCYSLARTCEISMMSAIGRPYESIIYLVDETTDKK